MAAEAINWAADTVAAIAGKLVSTSVVLRLAAAKMPVAIERSWRRMATEGWCFVVRPFTIFIIFTVKIDWTSDTTDLDRTPIFWPSAFALGHCCCD